jgi:probable phosphoglycerate mutase
MLLYCIRHGESAYNAEGRIQGQSDIALSELGQRQSAAAAWALAGLPIAAVYSSPLARAIQTAAPIARELGLDVQTDPRLMEIHAGVFQDLTRADIEQRYPAEIARWLSGDPDFQIPGGESRRELAVRGLAAFRAIAAAGHPRAAIISHGGLMAAALKALLDIPAARHPFVFQNGSISQIEINDGAVRLLTLNQVEHLQAIGLAGSGDL